MDGGVTADRYQQDLILALSAGPLANSTDHNESAKLLDNFRSNWVKANLDGADSDVMAGFSARAAGYEQNARATQASRVGNNIVAAAGDAFDQNIQGIMAESNTRGISADAVADGINREADKFLLAGGSKQDVNKAIIKAAAAYADENLDIGHAQAILDNINAGPGGKLGGTTAAKNVMKEVEDNITNKLHQLDSWAYTEQERKKQEIISNSSSIVGEGMLAAKIAGRPVTLDEYKTEISAVYKVGGWEAGQNFEKAIIASNKENFVEAQQTVDDLYVKVLSEHKWDPAMYDRMNRELGANTINRTTYSKLLGIMNEGQRQDKEDAKTPSFFKNDSYKIQGDDMDRFLGKDDVIFDATKELNRGQADAQFWTQIYRWDQEHPKATHDDQIEYATKVADRLKEQFRSPDLKLSGSVQSNVQKSPGVKSGAVNQIGAPKPEQDFQNLQDFHNALDEATKNPKGNGRINQKAAENGMSVLDYVKAQSVFYPEPQQPAVAPSK